MSEALVKRALKRYLDSIGAYYFMPVQMGLGSTTLDFLVCHKGKFYGIETKRSMRDGSWLAPTARQRLVMNKISDAGGRCWIENSTDLVLTRSVLGD